MELLKKKCLPCEGGVACLSPSQVKKYLKDLRNWKLSQDAKSISTEYVMPNFIKAVERIKKIAALAEKEQHHPDIHLTGYRKLKIELSTHAIGGLSENDFILAAKISVIR